MRARSHIARRAGATHRSRHQPRSSCWLGVAMRCCARRGTRRRCVHAVPALRHLEAARFRGPSRLPVRSAIARRARIVAGASGCRPITHERLSARECTCIADVLTVFGGLEVQVSAASAAFAVVVPSSSSRLFCFPCAMSDHGRSRTKPTESLERRVGFLQSGPTTIGQIWSGFGRTWAGSGRSRGKIGPIWPSTGLKSARFGRVRPKSAKLDPESTKSGPISTGRGQNLTENGKNGSGKGRMWAELDRDSSEIGRCRPRFATIAAEWQWSQRNRLRASHGRRPTWGQRSLPAMRIYRSPSARWRAREVQMPRVAARHAPRCAPGTPWGPRSRSRRRRRLRHRRRWPQKARCRGGVIASVVG